MELWAGYAFSLHANEAWARLTLIHPVELFTLETASVGTNMIFICHQHGKLSRQRQHRRMIVREYGTKQWTEWLRLRNSESALCELRAPWAGGEAESRRAVTDYSPDTCSPHAAFAEIFLQMVSNYELLSYDHVYIFRHMSIYVIYISVVFIKVMLLFTFNHGAYSANVMERQNSNFIKVEGYVYGLCYEYDYARHRLWPIWHISDLLL